MGIKGFSQTFVPTRIVSIKHMRGLTVAIDAMLELHRAAVGAKHVSTLTDSTGAPTMHISVILPNILEFQRNKVKQIWVFDHAQDPNTDFHNPMKIGELTKRKKRKEDALAKLLELKKEEKLFSDDEDDESPPKEIPKEIPKVIIQPNTNEDDLELSEYVSSNTKTKAQVKTKKVLPSVVVYTEEEEENMKKMNARQRSQFRMKKHKELQDLRESIKAENAAIDEENKGKPKKNKEDQKASLEKQIFRPTASMINDIKLILNCLNIPWLEAPAGFEGESVASYLTTIGLADAVFSGDTDPIANGALVQFRRNPRDKKIYEYTQTDILKQIESANDNIEEPSIDDIRKVAAVLGKDNSEKTPGIGPKTVLKKLHNIELTQVQEAVVADLAKQPERDSLIINNLDKTPFENCEKTALLDWLVNVKSFNKTRMQALFDKIEKPIVKKVKSKTASKVPPKITNKVPPKITNKVPPKITNKAPILRSFVNKSKLKKDSSEQDNSE
jgi:hypothetical protein